MFFAFFCLSVSEELKITHKSQSCLRISMKLNFNRVMCDYSNKRLEFSDELHTNPEMHV